jgi:putative endonuclease
MSSSTEWTVCMLRCVNGELYTGITTNLQRRLNQHSAGQGSKYVRSRRPFVLAFTATVQDESSARKLEHKIKKLPKGRKSLLLGKHYWVEGVAQFDPLDDAAHQGKELSHEVERR